MPDLSSIRDRLSDLPIDSIVDPVRKQVARLLTRKHTPAGIDIQGRRLKLAVLDPNKEAPAVGSLISRPIPAAHVRDMAIEDAQGVADEIDAAINEAVLPRLRATVAVGGNDVFMKRLQLPRSSAEEAARRVTETRDIPLPVGIAGSKVGVAVLDPDARGRDMEALLYTAKKESLRRLQQLVVNAGVAVDGVGVDSAALYNIFRFSEGGRVDGTVVLVDIGFDRSLVVVADEHGPVLARRVSVGVSRLVSSAADAVGSATAAEEAVFSHDFAERYGSALRTWVRSLANEIVKTARQNVSGIYLSGDGALVAGVEGLLDEVLTAPVPVETLRPLSAFPATDFDLVREANHGTGHALALGLALQQMGEQAQVRFDLKLNERIASQRPRSKGGRGRKFAVRDIVLDPAVVSFVLLSFFALGFTNYLEHQNTTRLAEDREAVQALQSENGRLRKEMDRGTEIQQIARSIGREIEAIEDLERNRFAFPHVLAEVAAAAPEDVWVDALETMGQDPDSRDLTVRVPGHAASPGALGIFMRRLEDSPFIRNVALRGSTTREDGPMAFVDFELELSSDLPAESYLPTVRIGGSAAGVAGSSFRSSGSGAGASRPATMPSSVGGQANQGNDTTPPSNQPR